MTAAHSRTIVLPHALVTIAKTQGLGAYDPRLRRWAFTRAEAAALTAEHQRRTEAAREHAHLSPGLVAVARKLGLGRFVTARRADGKGLTRRVELTQDEIDRAQEVLDERRGVSRRRPSPEAERKAAEYAELLEADGYARDEAIRRARETYGLEAWSGKPDEWKGGEAWRAAQLERCAAQRTESAAVIVPGGGRR